MPSPLNTKQAIAQFECDECRDGGDCGWDCVLSSTCSFRCPMCNARNWFEGSKSTSPPEFTCHNCHNTMENRFSGGNYNAKFK